MKQICCVCKTIYGEKEPYDDKRLTHGYCDTCFAMAIDEISNNHQKEMQKKEVFYEHKKDGNVVY